MTKAESMKQMRTKRRELKLCIYCAKPVEFLSTTCAGCGEKGRNNHRHRDGAKRITRKRNLHHLAFGFRNCSTNHS